MEARDRQTDNPGATAARRLPRRTAPPPWPAGRPLRAWQRAAAAAVLAHARRRVPRLRHSRRRQDDLRPARRPPDAREGRAARVAVSPRRRTSAASGRPTPPATASTSSPTGPMPPGRNRATATASPSPTQTLAAGPGVHRRRCAELPTLLIADEPHHMGELAAWGRSTRGRVRAGALPAAALRHAVPLRHHADPVGRATTTTASPSADYAYGYTDALLDGVCRPVTFHTYDGDMEWMCDGRRRRPTSRSACPAAEAARRLRTALDPDGEWVAHVLRDAHRELAALRAGDHPDAGGLVIAADKEHAERLAERLARIAGERREIVTSDAPDASARIAPLRGGRGQLAGVGADGLRGRRRPAPARRRLRDSARTELFFRQVVGRFVRRTRRRGPDEPPVPAQRPDAQAARGADRGGAQPRAALEPAGEAFDRGERGGRATRSGRCGRAPAATTTCCRRPQPGETMRCSPTPRRHRRPRWRRSRRPRPRPPTPPAPPRARPPTSAASGCARSAGRWSSRRPAPPARSTA